MRCTGGTPAFSGHPEYIHAIGQGQALQSPRCLRFWAGAPPVSYMGAMHLFMAPTLEGHCFVQVAAR